MAAFLDFAHVPLGEHETVGKIEIHLMARQGFVTEENETAICDAMLDDLIPMIGEYILTLERSGKIPKELRDVSFAIVLAASW